MNFSLRDVPLPIRFRPAVPMTDDELIRFCAVNETLRVEREPNGELIVMTPAGNRTGRRNTAIITVLEIWTRTEQRG